jgi:hypothetical protein
LDPSLASFAFKKSDKNQFLESDLEANKIVLYHRMESPRFVEEFKTRFGEPRPTSAAEDNDHIEPLSKVKISLSILTYSS